MYYGDGSHRSADTLKPIVTMVAGNNTSFNCTQQSGGTGDNGPAANSTFSSLGPVAAAADGSIYIAEDNLIRKIDGATGIITRFAGGGASNDDGQPALSSNLGTIRAIALGPDETVYFADDSAGTEVPAAGHTVRYIDSAGPVHRLIVGGSSTSVNGVQALTAMIGDVRSLAVAPDGSIDLMDFVIDLSSGSESVRLFRMSMDGFLRIVTRTPSSAPTRPRTARP